LATGFWLLGCKFLEEATGFGQQAIGFGLQAIGCKLWFDILGM